MKHINLFWSVLALLIGPWLLSSCLDQEETVKGDSYDDVFEACWQTMDERYCFFEEKGVDWNQIYRLYKPYARDSVKNIQQLLGLLDQMLDTLKDGHVNVYTPFNVARYWKWYEDYPINFDANLVQKYYLKDNYWSAGSFQFSLLREDSVAYVRYSSFANDVGSTNLDYMLMALRRAKGMILDIRNNGGGDLTNANLIAERFCTEKTLYGYIQHKTGKGHNDLSKPEPLYLDPSPKGRWSWDASTQPLVVLTNRHTFSAANNFIQIIKELDGTMTTDSVGAQHPKMIKVCGDRTGGGSGMPFESVLPNGWALRFSACPITDARGHSTESGIDPSEGMKVDMDSLSAFNDHRDDIIEAARAYIVKHTRMSEDKNENAEKRH